jgi:hypothetical protein
MAELFRVDDILGETFLSFIDLEVYWHMLSNWFMEHWVFLAIFSVLSFIASIAGSTMLLMSLPADYFRTRKRIRRIKNPVFRICLSSLKNLFGGLLVIVGIFLSLPGIPGQGILTILTGLIISDFPGKRRLERRLVRVPIVLSAANQIRSRFKRPPLVLDD